MSTVVYTRVSSATKLALDSLAATRGASISAVVAALLDHGVADLQTAADARETQARVDELELELARREVVLRQSSLAVAELERREAERILQFRSLANRAELPAGKCPFCGEPVTGRDVLIFGRCPNVECALGLTAAAVDPPPAKGEQEGLDRQELMMLLAALGVMAGALWLGSKTN